MADLKAFAEQLVNLSVKEVNELAKILKDEYGIEPAAAAVAVVEGGGAAGADQRQSGPVGPSTSWARVCAAAGMALPAFGANGRRDGSKRSWSASST